MKTRNLFALIGSAALLLLAASCGGGGYSYGGGSSGGGGGGGGGSGSSAVTITPASSTIAINATQQFVAQTSGADVGSEKYTWISSDTSVATIDGNGLATGVAAGTTNITVTSKYTTSGYSYTATSDPVVLTVSASGMVTGTAAVGHPFVAALVSLKDAHGQSQFALTDAQGRFAVAVSGLMPPFLLKVSDDQGHVMYSLGNSAGVINIDPFSDVITRAWFESLGTSMETVFANPQGHLVVSDASLQKIDHALVNALTASLNAHGVNPSQLSLLHTAFTADGSGLDGVLDHTRFTQQDGRFLIANAATGDNLSLAALRHSITIRVLNPDAQHPTGLQTLRF